ncbi:hypothetical protein PINS_up004453 [Pythium insidiosum]|nr:hypothetical protein PINS_up004453 [Pythium insidiosum]
MKLMMRGHRRRIARGTLSRLGTMEEIDEASLESAVEPLEPEVPRPIERRSIGAYETRDITWKAVIEGELEKFMYPSLRLESLYQTRESSPALGARSPTARGEKTMREPKPPAPEEVEKVMSPVVNRVEWQCEKRYQNATQSAPANGHARLDERERENLRLDVQLETAEGLLRKKEQELLEVKKQQGMLTAMAIRAKAKADATAKDIDVEQLLVNGRDRGASLYQPHIINSQQLIPRLPHTRK